MLWSLSLKMMFLSSSSSQASHHRQIQGLLCTMCPSHSLPYYSNSGANKQQRRKMLFTYKNARAHRPSHSNNNATEHTLSSLRFSTVFQYKGLDVPVDIFISTVCILLRTSDVFETRDSLNST
eukprot:m.38934 g.38934  ORF g.38934 m.38934 type:complete len:123 (+) comp10250_c0_seq5:221-589(+)